MNICPPPFIIAAIKAPALSGVHTLWLSEAGRQQSSQRVHKGLHKEQGQFRWANTCPETIPYHYTHVIPPTGSTLFLRFYAQ